MALYFLNGAPGVWIAAVSEETDVLETARRELARFGLAPRLVAHRTFRSDALAYTVTLLELVDT